MWCKTVLSVALILTVALPSYANDEPLKASAPLGPAAAPEATVEVDVLAFVKSMREQLALHSKAPRHTAIDHGLYDLWHAILRPRIGRMIRRVQDLQHPKRWTKSEQGLVLGLAPDAWSRTTRNMAALYTELGAALKRYERASVSFTSPYGLGLDRRPAVYVGYPLEHLGPVAMERELYRRLRGGRVIWRDELRAHWRLLGRFHLHYLRQAHLWQRVEVPGEPEAMRAAHEKHEEAIDRTAESLRVQMLGLRTLMATLQAVEEDRLRTKVLASTLNPEAQGALLEMLGTMRQGRLDARDYEGDKHAEYGQRLRSRWLAVRTKLLAKLPK